MKTCLWKKLRGSGPKIGHATSVSTEIPGATRWNRVSLGRHEISSGSTWILILCCLHLSANKDYLFFWSLCRHTARPSITSRTQVVCSNREARNFPYFFFPMNILLDFSSRKGTVILASIKWDAHLYIFSHFSMLSDLVELNLTGCLSILMLLTPLAEVTP